MDELHATRWMAASFAQNLATLHANRYSIRVYSSKKDCYVPGGNYERETVILCSNLSSFRSSCSRWMQESTSGRTGVGAELRRLDVAGCSAASEYAGYRRISRQPGGGASRPWNSAGT